MISRRAFVLTAAGLFVPALTGLGQRARDLARKGGAANWAAGGIAFDGNSWLYKTTGNVGPNSKTGTVSFWYKVTNASSGYVLMARNTASSSQRANVNKSNLGALIIEIDDGSAASVITLTSATGILPVSSAWVHVYARWDSATGSGNILLNGSQVTTSITGVQNVAGVWAVPYASVGNRISSSTASSPVYGSLAEIWLATSDLGTGGVGAFYAGGKPKYLGPNGALPGAAPVLYLSRSSTEAKAAFLTNRGSTGGTWTENGTLALDNTLAR
jgi:hypothetical protein